MHAVETLLEGVGIDPAAETVYVGLLDQPGATLDEIARLTGLGRRQVRAACALLETKGLLSRSPGRPTVYLPAPPDVAIEALIGRQKEGLEHARLGVSGLLDRYRRGSGSSSRSDEFVEVIAGREAIAQRFLQLQRAAQKEILTFDKPPYVTDSAANESTELEVIRRGVAYRTIYDTSSLMTGQLEIIQRLITDGEHARTMSDVPMKLVIADRRLGLVPLRQDEPGLEGRLLVHSSPLLDALIMLFEILWERATSLHPGGDRRQDRGPGPISDDERTLLLMLTAGLKDEGIAQRLRVTERTVARRVQRLFKKLGAQTRFQAGLNAARRGWLD